MNPLSGPAGGGIPAWIPPLAGPEGTPRLCPVPTQLHHPLPQPMEGQGAQQTQAAAGGVRIEQEEKDSCPRANPKPPLALCSGVGSPPTEQPQLQSTSQYLGFNQH